MKKFTSALAMVILACLTASAVSCGDKTDNSNSGNMLVGSEKPTDMDNETYQNTYASNDDLLPSQDSNVSIQISYDNSYWNDSTGYDELYLVDKYVSALNSGDVKAINDCYYPGFLEGICKDSGSYESAEAFIKDYYAQMEDTFGEGFQINFIEISNCQLAGDLEADSRFATRDENLKKIFGDDIASKISDRKLLTIGGYSYYGNADTKYITELTNVLPEGILFCVYTIDGKPYIF